MIDWLSNSFINKNEKNAENVLIDIPASSRLELLFGTVKPQLLKFHTKLLEDLKNITRFRNKIVHKGERATKKQALNCLDMVSMVVMIIHFEIDPESMTDPHISRYTSAISGKETTEEE